MYLISAVTADDNESLVYLRITILTVIAYPLLANKLYVNYTQNQSQSVSLYFDIS
jgi:hypothetical protein